MKKRHLIVSLLWIGLVFSTYAQQGTDTLRILFVGNSYTYFWNLPQTVEAMAIAQNIPLVARQSTAGGVNWKQHWDGDKGLKSRQIIENGDWDVVVLQNHSKSTIDNIDQFHDYGMRLIDLVKSQGAIPVLYQTWAREFNPLMQATISEGYDQLAKKAGIQVVRVGELWEKAQALRPEIMLFDPDQSHPSPIGTYLTATAFFSFFTGENASVLDKRIMDVDRNGEKLYLSIMSEQNAEFLQDLVDTYLTEEWEAHASK